MPSISRRAMFKTGAALAAGAAAMSTNAAESIAPVPTGDAMNAPASSSSAAPDTFGHTIPFGDEYYNNILPIIEAVRANELARIDDVSSRMAAAVRAGAHVWMQAKQGHMGKDEFDMANRGNPGLFQSNSGWDDSDYDRMRPGDILITNYINDNVAAARSSGVYVVGVTVPYQNSPSAPPGIVNPNANGWFLSDVSDVIIDTHCPWQQGIVTCPEIPEMKICPSSANPLVAVFWMLTAEATSKFYNPSASGSSKAAELIDTLIDRLRSAYPAGRDRVFASAKAAADRIIAGAHYHVTSDHGGVAREAAGVASGPMMTNAFAKDPRPGDIHLLASIEPDSTAILDAAQKARDLGQYTVGIAPASSTRLAALSDVFIDNACPEGGGLISIPNCPGNVGAIGGIVNNVLMWTFTAQFVDEMIRRGAVPWFWMGFYLAGGKEYDDAIRPFFMRQGY